MASWLILQGYVFVRLVLPIVHSIEERFICYPRIYESNCHFHELTIPFVCDRFRFLEN